MPSDGHWVLDTGHFPRPATCFTAELFPDPSREGFAAGTAPYGLLLDYVEWEFVERWGYLSAKPVAPLRAAAPADRAAWDDLVRTSPELARRLATSASVFVRRAWREDLALWDDRLRPSLVEGHREIQAVDPRSLNADDLLDHLDRCRANLRRAITVHHRLDVTPVLPVGDLLVQARRWAGVPAADLLALLHGAGPLAIGAARDLHRLAEAVRADAAARSLLESHTSTPDEVLASLCSAPGPAGEVTAGYVARVGHWSSGTGLDVGEPSLGELPGLLVESVRAAVAGSASEGTASEGTTAEAADRAAHVRRAVPAENRQEFDGLLAEARLVHRLRDERALSCDVWANGLMRRAILAAGERLAAHGRIDQPPHLVESTWAEMRSLVDTGAGPTADELAARARYRSEAVADDLPVLLGDPPRTPVPTEWLDPGAARTEAAFRTYLGAMAGMSKEPTGSGTGKRHDRAAFLTQNGPSGSVRGQGVSPGVYVGPARIVDGAGDFGRIRRGDVLVTVATSPAFNVVLPLVGAVVTDRGGLLSHAAIVAREYGIPAVVGCGDATAHLAEGAAVRVDGTVGEVTPL